MCKALKFGFNSGNEFSAVNVVGKSLVYIYACAFTEVSFPVDSGG